MNTRSFEEKIYNINKKIWHADHLGELHHACRKVGVRLCCPALFVAGKPGHENDYRWVNATRRMLRPVEKIVLENYVKGCGCKKQRFKICEICAMPQIAKGE